MNLLRELTAGVATRDAADTMFLGERIGMSLRSGVTVALYGDLGSGKTTFAKGLAAGLGVMDSVKSPSYNIYSVYEGRHMRFVHVDAYRLETAGAFEDLLIDELVPDPKVLCVEWPEKIGDCLPLNALRISFSIESDGAHFMKTL